MQNYRYNTSDYARYGNRSRQSYPPAVSHSPTASAYREKETTYDSSNKMMLAMAYVPWQEWQNIYDMDKAFCRGTIFCDLDKPFLGNGGCCR